MPNFCVNRDAQRNGDHEVHDNSQERWCLPTAANRVDLGWHASCSGAVSLALQKGYARANGCAHCAPACHTS